MPVLARLDDLGTFVLVLAGCDEATAAVGHVSHMCQITTFRGRRHHSYRPSIVSSEVEEPLPESDAWAAAEIPLAQRDEAREDHYEIRREMMRLQMVEIEKVPKEGAGGDSEATLKVSVENDSLASTRIGHELGAGSTPLDLGRHLAGANQGLDGTGGDRGTLPAPPAGLRGVSPGRHGACGREENEDEERKVAVRGYRDGRGEHECAAGADSVRGGGVTSTLKSLGRSSNGVRESEKRRTKKAYERRRSPRPSPVAYMGGGGGEWDPAAAVWPGVA